VRRRFEVAALWLACWTAVPLSIAAAFAFAAVPILWIVTPGFTLARPWLFGLGAGAFALDPVREVHPAARIAAAVLQAVCVFEVLGFSIGLTVTIYAGTIRWQVVDWGAWLVALALLVLGGSAMTAAGVTLRAIQQPAVFTRS
jgi:hypothetical protein